MSRRTVPEKVNEYVKKHIEIYNLLITDINEIKELGNIFDIICTAYAYGYMKGSKKKGGAKK